MRARMGMEGGMGAMMGAQGGMMMGRFGGEAAERPTSVEARSVKRPNRKPSKQRRRPLPPRPGPTPKLRDDR